MRSTVFSHAEQIAATIFFWRPYLWGKYMPHPGISAMLKGDLGHVSLLISHPIRGEKYFSVWPQVDLTENDHEGKAQKKVALVATKEYDIELEGGRLPLSKQSAITDQEYREIREHVERVESQLQKALEYQNGDIWSIKSNCADSVYEALRAAELIVERPTYGIPRTPQDVFKWGLDRSAVFIQKAEDIQNEYR